MMFLSGATTSSITFVSASKQLHSDSSKFCTSSHVSSSSLSFQNKRLCECLNLSKELIPYGDAWNLQKDIVREKKLLISKNEECPDTLIILQHHPVFTMGTSSSIEYLNFDVENSPYEVYRTERGGEVTYHGPGQLVVYPIFNLRNHKMDLHWYLRALEEVAIRVLSSPFSIKASRVDGLTGVWVGDKKLAAIGIKVSNWITYHGLALNVTTDLTPFSWIVPCGIRDREVGSVKGLMEEAVGGGCENAKVNVDDIQLMEMAYRCMIKEFSQVFELQIHHSSSNFLERDAGI